MEISFQMWKITFAASMNNNKFKKKEKVKKKAK
jgi:hypothetical protein